ASPFWHARGRRPVTAVCAQPPAARRPPPAARRPPPAARRPPLGLGEVRWVVERAFAWRHRFKGLRIRYERRADLHPGLLELGCGRICLRRLRTTRN
ncbi:hypothetical protein ACFT0D_46965, partial [Streptomyces sp. NPDC056982]